MTMKPPGKILVRGVNWLGDAVMTTPALLRLREHFRDAEITVLSPEKLAALYLAHPAVDRVLMSSRGDGPLNIATWLRDEKFDLAVVFPNSPRSALEVFLSRVPERVGYARPLRNWMLTRRVADRPNITLMHKRSPAEVRERIAAGAVRDTFPASAHHVHHYLHLVGAIGCNPSPLAPLLHMDAREITSVREKFRLPGARSMFGLNAGAEYGPAKRWPEERFIEAAIRIFRSTQCTWILLGGPADRELTARIEAQLSRAIGVEAVCNLAGQTTLRELCAVMKACELVLTNDTGPMHVAAALGTPVIVPFGSTSPELTGPGLPGGTVNRLLMGEAACAPCFLRECPIDFRCMKNITVEQIVTAVIDVHGRRIC
ncbi:MAG TPA: lipopolysaccharide heptosyltransferase II [Candidatus Acidoferrum sp.]|nr:lipopolysaccharide heptosyltransferase II [Candidatus Acidoferrum sp.]